MNLHAHDQKLTSISDYYSATQLRSDRWSALRETVEALTRHRGEERKTKKLIARAEALFEALAQRHANFTYVPVRRSSCTGRFRAMSASSIFEGCSTPAISTISQSRCAVSFGR